LLNYFYTTLFEENIEKIKNKNVDLGKIIERKNISKNFKNEIQKADKKIKANTNS
jgi:hypothetical protein